MAVRPAFFPQLRETDYHQFRTSQRAEKYLPQWVSTGRTAATLGPVTHLGWQTMAGDWLKLYRRMLDHPVMKNSWLCHLWVWCLLRANYESKPFGSIMVEPGQFVAGRHRCAESLNVTPSKFLRGLKKLSSPSWNLISLKSNNQYTLVTICNWSTYQSNADMEADSDRTAIGQQTDSDRTTNGQRSDTTKERKNDKKERKEESKTLAASPPAKPRPRNPLFDAIAEITASDVSIKTIASHVGKVAAALAKAEPPYTPEDVRSLPLIAETELGWAAGRHLTPGEVEKYIGRIRASENGQVRSKGKPTLADEFREGMQGFLGEGDWQ